MRMLLVLAAVAQVTVIPRATAPAKDYPIRAVPLTSVRITDGSCAPKRAINRSVTIPHIMQQNEATGRIDNFLKAAKKKPGAYQLSVGRQSDDPRRPGVITGTVAGRTITAIPYYAWNNRRKGEMAVWIPY